LRKGNQAPFQREREGGNFAADWGTFILTKKKRMGIGKNRSEPMVCSKKQGLVWTGRKPNPRG